MTLLSDNGDTREDLKLPDGDLGKEIQAKFDNEESVLLTVLTSMGEEAVIAQKTGTSDK